MAPLMLAGLALVGCSGGDDPVLDPTPTATSSEDVSPEPTHEVTATPTQDPTPEPDPTAELEAQITAFFKEYAQTINESWTSKKALERRRKMFADSCESCLAGYQIVKRAHAENLTFQGEFTKNLEVTLTGVENNVVVFLAVSDTPAAALVGSDGSVVESFKKNLNRQVVYQATKNEDGNWLIISDEVL